MSEIGKEWYRRRMEGLLLSYAEGKKKVTSNMVLGAIQGALGRDKLTKGEVLDIFIRLENLPHLTESEKRRLKELRTTAFQ